MAFLTKLEVTEILCSFRLVLEGKTGKEIPDSSRLQFLERFLANKFAFLDAESNNSGPFNRGGTVDLLLLRTQLAIRRKSREPSFWGVIELFICKILQLRKPFCNDYQPAWTLLHLQKNYWKVLKIGKNIRKNICGSSKVCKIISWPSTLPSIFHGLCKTHPPTYLMYETNNTSHSTIALLSK